MARVELHPKPGFSPLAFFGIVIGVIAWLLFTFGTYTIESGSVGVLSTFGEFSDDIKQPGLHFMAPGVQNYRIVDVKTQTAHYQGGTDLPDNDGVINRPRIVVLDSKNLNIGVEISVQFTPDAEQAKKILVQYGRNYFEKLINPIIRDIVRDIAGQYQAEEIALKRSSISNEIREKLSEKFATSPFILNDVQIRNIELPKIVRTKIEEVQLAKQEEQRLAMIEKQARKNQEIKSIQANTKLIEVTTQAKADAEKKKIEAEAKAFQIITEAEALANANKLVAKSVTPELIQYESIKRWSGDYPKMLVDGDKSNGLIMQLPRIK